MTAACTRTRRPVATGSAGGCWAARSWLLGGALLVGWAAGVATHVPELGLSMLSAFLAGMIVLNVFKEELPEERQSRFSAFAVGLAVYGALLLAQ